MVISFTFNAFAENTYLLYDDTRECIIIDPGCYTQEERDTLKNYIDEHRLKPILLLNTHCHLDHVFGNKWVIDTWGLTLAMHRGEMGVLQRYPDVCRQYGIPNFDPSPMPNKFIEEGDTITFGNSVIKALLTPGHSPASLSFYNDEEAYVIAGDALFHESIGRTDLPGGNHELLLQSIREQLFTLPAETLVYSGHGDTTTIRHETEYNPFF